MSPEIFFTKFSVEDAYPRNLLIDAVTSFAQSPIIPSSASLSKYRPPSVSTLFTRCPSRALGRSRHLPRVVSALGEPRLTEGGAGARAGTSRPFRYPLVQKAHSPFIHLGLVHIRFNDRRSVSRPTSRPCEAMGNHTPSEESLNPFGRPLSQFECRP